jgi:hypothetical protein
MLDNLKSNVQLIILALMLPATWLLFVYFVNPFWFIEDKFGIFRFIVFIALVFIYYKANFSNTVKQNLKTLMLIFIIYLVCFYVLDILINLVFDKDLKFDFYGRDYDNSAVDNEAELKALNSGFKLASKAEAVNTLVYRNYSLKAYMKIIALDLLKFSAVLLIFIPIYRKNAK